MTTNSFSFPFPLKAKKISKEEESKRILQPASRKYFVLRKTDPLCHDSASVT